MIFFEVVSVFVALAIAYQFSQLHQKSDEMNDRLRDLEDDRMNLRLKEIAQDEALTSLVAVANAHERTLITVLHHVQHHDEGHAKSPERMQA